MTDRGDRTTGSEPNNEIPDGVIRAVDVPEELVEPLVNALEEGRVSVLSAESIESFERLAAEQTRVRREVAQLKERARRRLRQERDDVLSAAKRKGYREGFDAVVEGLATGVELRRRARREAVELGFDIAGRIIGAKVARDDGVLEGIVEDLLRRHTDGEEAVVLTVHPDDRDVLDGIRGRLSVAAGGVSVRLEVDASIRRGGCVLRTGGRRVDARIDVRLEAIKAALLDD